MESASFVSLYCGGALKTEDLKPQDVNDCDSEATKSRRNWDDTIGLEESVENITNHYDCAKVYMALATTF